MPDRNEKLERWMNAYLDGTLSPSDAAKFESVIERNPQVRARIELQRQIEAALGRVFAPPAEIKAAADGSGEPTTLGLATEQESHAPGRKSRGWLKGLAIAAAIAIAVGGWWAWQVSYQVETSPAGPRWYTLAQFYEESSKDGFAEDWVCQDEREFQSTFWYRVGSGVQLAQAPPGIDVLGLKYGPTLSAMTVHLMAKIEGEGAIVFVDKKAPSVLSKIAEKQAGIEAAGLHAHRRDTDRLIMIEVSRRDRPYLLELLTETDIPQDWKDDLRIPARNAP